MNTTIASVGAAPPSADLGADSTQDDSASVACNYDRVGIEAFIPHRGEILFLQQMTTHGDKHFTGVAHWDVGTMGLRGHFPQRAVVPAVFLVEAIAQLAGAGVLATRTVPEMSVPQIGVMMAIRRCSFRQIVHVSQSVELEVRIRQMGEQAVTCEGTVSRNGVSVASIEVLIGEVALDVILTDKEA